MQFPPQQIPFGNTLKYITVKYLSLFQASNLATVSVESIKSKHFGVATWVCHNPKVAALIWDMMTNHPISEAAFSSGRPRFSHGNVSRAIIRIVPTSHIWALVLHWTSSLNILDLQSHSDMKCLMTYESISICQKLDGRELSQAVSHDSLAGLCGPSGRYPLPMVHCHCT